jgi:hypothetical protein
MWACRTSPCVGGLPDERLASLGAVVIAVILLVGALIFAAGVVVPARYLPLVLLALAGALALNP